VTKDPSTIPEDTPRKRKTRHSQNPPVESHVGWIMDSRAHLKEDTGSEVGSLGSRFGFGSFLFWFLFIKTFL
jgi:la-related protein 1